MEPASILVIRRDNIGDLLCTTPLFTSLRQRWPQARIDALVNDYNAPVLAGNPDLDRVWSYAKAKHSEHGRLRAWLREARLYWTLRRQRYDLVIHANPVPHRRTAKLVRLLRPAAGIGVVDPTDAKTAGVYSLALSEDDISGTHHVERVHSLLRPLGIDARPGPMTLASAMASAPDRRTIGVHISSRKPCNRWPAEHYVSVINALSAAGFRPQLFWAPGSRDNPKHPGDDELAAEIAAQCPGASLQPTTQLHELVAGLAGVSGVVCCDGGGLHIAVALGKPVVALFGCTNAEMWGPWAVPNQVLNGHGEAANIPPEAVTEKARALFAGAL